MIKIFEIVQERITSLDSLTAVTPADIRISLSENQHFILYACANEALHELGTLECLGVVQAYEVDNFGRLYTKLSDSCQIANMVIDILVGDILDTIFSGTKYYDELWNVELTDHQLNKMARWAKLYFKQNDDVVLQAWGKLPLEPRVNKYA